MILLFTSNTNGGIVQFIIQLLCTINGMSMDAHCFIPKGAQAFMPTELGEKIHLYDKYKSINGHDRRITDVAKKMLQIHPDIIWYVDSSILTLHMIELIKGKVKQLLTLHDAGTRHPTYQKGIKSWIQIEYSSLLLKRGISDADNILVLSEESRKLYSKKYPAHKNKVLKMNLCAHIPDVPAEKPKELPDGAGSYFLFFGRIDKYKGIMNMVSAYKKASSVNTPLVIAGNGDFSADEKEGIESDKRIIVINRYILDSEMIWLFSHARAAVLPYIEATQSGIIPIAYKYGVPVITSDVPGLTQFVEDGRTGYICKTTDEYVLAFSKISDGNDKSESYKTLSINCIDYSKRKLNWDRNVDNLLNKLKNGDSSE